MYGNMMQMPLLISALLRHADSYHGDTEIVSRLAPGEIHRYAYRDAHRRTRQLANALGSLGVAQSSRVGTLAWNTHRHFELYFAVSGMGAIINTINPRLFPEQVEYIVNHAEDEIICFDLAFLPLVEKIAARCPRVKAWVALTGAGQMPESALKLLWAFGDLLVRGPWVTAAYFKADGGSILRDGWFPTGDVATLDEDGFVQITDRSKDVINRAASGSAPSASKISRSRIPRSPRQRSSASRTPSGPSGRCW